MKDQRGNAVVEMSLVCALIAVVCISSSAFVGTETGKVLHSVGFAIGLGTENPNDTSLSDPSGNNPSGNGTNPNGKDKDRDRGGNRLHP